MNKYLYELCSNLKWECSGRNTSRFQFRCCENNIEVLFQNNLPTLRRYFKMTFPLFQILQTSYFATFGSSAC